MAIVEKIVDRHGSRELAKAYLQALFEPAGQEIAARHRLRPRSAEVLARHAAEFPAIQLCSVEEEFGGWPKAQATHFADGGFFDQIYLK